MVMKGLTMVIADEESYPARLGLVRELENHRKICYVCLNSLACDVKDELDSLGIDTSRYHFINTLNPPGGHHATRPGFSQVSSPYNTQEILDEMKRLGEECSAFVFDPITSMLHFHDVSSMVLFTNEVAGRSRVLFIVLHDGIVPESELKRFIADAGMFAMSIRELSSGRRE